MLPKPDDVRAFGGEVTVTTSVRTEQEEFLRGSLRQSVEEFFRDYGVEVRASESMVPDAAPPSELEMGSLVGFRGRNDVRGGLAFVAPAALVARMLPVPPRPKRQDIQLRDWSAEIANQLVGRLKNKLSAHAIDFDVGTPVCFRGTSIRFAFLPEATGMALHFATDSEAVRVYLDCEIVSDDSSETADEVMRLVPEGDVIIF